MGVPGNVFQRGALEVTSHVREAGVRVLSFAVEDEHALTQRVAVLTVGDVAELHRSLGAWLEAAAASDVPRLSPVPQQLREFVEMIARMQTEKEAGGFTCEDAFATVNDLIEAARPLVAEARPSRVTVIEFRKRVLCIACGGEHTPGACGAGAA